MHSNWKIWDLLKSRPKIIDEGGPKLIAIQSFDPFAFKLIKDLIPRTLFANETLNTIMAKDVTVNWLEDNLKSLGLFGNSDSFLIIDANNLSKPCKDFLVNVDELILNDCFLILDYSKEDELLKKIKNHENVELIKIQAPAFWEGEKLLDFLADKLSVYLDYSSKTFILEKVDANIADLYNLMVQVKINYGDKLNISVEEVRSLIMTEKVDQFELANDFASKKIKNFYHKISHINDYNQLRSVFMFMQSHLLKVYDPSYTSAKPRLTKYDKEIISQSKIWNKKDIDKAIKYFSVLEIKAKEKNPLLFYQIKQGHLRTL